MCGTCGRTISSVFWARALGAASRFGAISAVVKAVAVLTLCQRFFNREFLNRRRRAKKITALGHCGLLDTRKERTTVPSCLVGSFDFAD